MYVNAQVCNCFRVMTFGGMIFDQETHQVVYFYLHSTGKRGEQTVDVGSCVKAKRSFIKQDKKTLFDFYSEKRKIYVKVLLDNFSLDFNLLVK